MTFKETFTGKGIRPGKFRRLGYLSVIYGLLIFLTVQFFYIPYVWRAHWTSSEHYTPEEEIELINQANAQHPEAALLIRVSFLLLAAGSLIALKNRYYDYAGTKMQMVYLFMVIWTLFLFIAHPPDKPLFATNTIIYGRLSPGILVIMPFLLLSTNPRIWPYFQRFLLYMCGYATVMGILGVIQLDEASRQAAFRWVWMPGLVLEMTVLFPIIYLKSDKILVKIAAVFPLFTLILLDVVLQYRGGFVILAVFVIVYVLMRRDDDTRESNRNQRIMYSIFAITAASIAFLLMPSVGDEGVVGQSYNAFMGRMDQDTRSSQWVNFAEALEKNGDVYLWGRGHIYNTDLNDFGGGGVAGIDSGYMNIMWVGGLPLLFAFLLFSAMNAGQAFFKRLSIDDIIVVALAMGFVVRMASSTSAGFEAQYLLFLVLLGRVIYIASDKKRRKKRRRRKRSLVRSTVR